MPVLKARACLSGGFDVCILCTRVGILFICVYICIYIYLKLKEMNTQRIRGNKLTS